MSYRESREGRYRKEEKYMYLSSDDYKSKKGREDGPRTIAIKMYKEGKTLDQILYALRFFDEENIIGWLLDEFPRTEVMQYYMKNEKRKIMEKRLKEKQKEEVEER